MKNKVIIICFLMLFLVFSSCINIRNRGIFPINPSISLQTGSNNQQETKLDDTKIDFLDISNLVECKDLTESFNSKVSNFQHILDSFSKCKENVYILFDENNNFQCILNNKRTQKIEKNKLRVVKFYIYDQKIYRIELFSYAEKNPENMIKIDKDDSCIDNVKKNIDYKEIEDSIFNLLLQINNFLYFESVLDKKSEISICYKDESYSKLKDALSFIDLSIDSLKKTIKKECKTEDQQKDILDAIIDNVKNREKEGLSIICFKYNKLEILKKFSNIFGKYYWHYDDCENLVADKLLIIDKNQFKVSLSKELNLVYFISVKYENILQNDKVDEKLIEQLLNYDSFLKTKKKELDKQEISNILKFLNEKLKPEIILIPSVDDKLILDFITKNMFNEKLLVNHFVFPSLVNFLYVTFEKNENPLSKSINDLKEIISKSGEFSCTLDNDKCKTITENKKIFKNYSYLVEYLSYDNNVNPFILYSLIYLQQKNLDICTKSETKVENLVNYLVELSLNTQNIFDLLVNNVGERCLGMIVVYAWLFNHGYNNDRPKYDFSKINRKDVFPEEQKYFITLKAQEEEFNFCNHELDINNDELQLIEILFKSNEEQTLLKKKDEKFEDKKPIVFEDKNNKIIITYDLSNNKLLFKCYKKINFELFKDDKSQINDEIIVKYYDEDKIFNIFHKKFAFSLVSLSLEGKDNEEIEIYEKKYSYNFILKGFGNNVNSLEDALNVFDEIKLNNNENIKDKLITSSELDNNINIKLEFKNKQLIFEVTINNINEAHLHSIEFLQKNKIIKIERKINYIKDLIIQGKLIATLNKINGIKIENDKIEIPLKNMNISIIVDNKEFSTITDSEGNFKITTDIDIKGKEVIVKFFYQRNFLDKIKINVSYLYLEEVSFFQSTLKTLEPKTQMIEFNTTLKNFCNDKNNDLYNCKGNLITFNLNINEKTKEQFNSVVKKDYIMYVFYTYHFLDYVIDFYNSLLKDTLKDFNVYELNIVIALDVNSNAYGEFNGNTIKLYNSAYQHNVHFFTLAHEFAHFILDLKHDLMKKHYISFCFNHVINIEKISENNCKINLNYFSFSIKNYGGLRNPSTVDSLNEALARLMENVIFQDYIINKKTNSIYINTKLEEVRGINLELNENPYSFKKEDVDFKEILSIASFLQDIIDNTPNEIVLSETRINEILKKLYISGVDLSQEIKDTVYIDFFQFWNEIIMDNYNNFNFYELYNKLIKKWGSKKEEIEKIALANLLYYNKRSGNKNVEDYELIANRLECNVIFSSNLPEHCENKNQFLITLDKSCQINYDSRLKIIQQKLCKPLSSQDLTLNLDYPCQKYSKPDECIYELYTFIYDKSLQGEIGIISFDGHYLKDGRKKEIKEFPNSQLLIKDPVSEYYLVEIRFLENYGLDNYSYLQKIDQENKLYIPPIPFTYLAEIRVKPYFDEQNYSVKKEYVINSREMNERIINSDKDYFDEVKFELVSINQSFNNQSKETNIQNTFFSYRLIKILLISFTILISFFIIVGIWSKKFRK